MRLNKPSSLSACQLTLPPFATAGVIAQLQPKFLANRDLYETREKGAKMYTWKAVGNCPGVAIQRQY